MLTKIEITPYLSQKIKLISLLSIILVFVQHGSYGLPNTGIRGAFKHLVGLGLADYPVSFFFIVSGYFLSRKFTPTFAWYISELKKRSLSLLVPYLIYISIGFWLFNCSSRISILEGLGLTSLTPAVGPLWYVRTLIVLCIISPIIIRITSWMARYPLLRYSGFIVFTAASLIAFPGRKSGMSIFYFSFGTFLTFYGNCLNAISTKVKFNASIIILIMLLISKLHHVMLCSYNSSEVFLRWQIIPFTIASIWYGYDLLFKGHVPCIPQWLRFASETTFFIYCTESFIRRGLTVAIGKAAWQPYMNTPLGIIISSFSIAAMGLLIARILQHTLPSVYKLLSGGR